ncbi:MAG: murein biosynthesis integral membrane protein MurJ [Buchnera aphidicola (Meitanaphis flavogallis)]
MNVLKLLISLSFITFCSRILGFIRDTFIAYTFGASGLTDAFFLAFKIPNLFRRIFAEGFFSQIFIPVLSEFKNIHNVKFIKEFISNVLGLMMLFLGIFTFLGIYFASNIVSIIAPGLNNNPYELYLTTKLLEIVFPYIFFVSLGSLISSILNTWNYFFIPACSPMILNLNIIVFILFFSSYFSVSIFSLAWATLLGGLIQVFYQIPFLRRIDMLVFPKLNIKNIGLQTSLKKISIIVIGMLISQISVIINTIFSSFLVPGSISWIYYADRLVEFISGIFGVSLGTILLPLLSNSKINTDKRKYSKLLNWALRIGCLVAIPSSIVLAILSKIIIIVLFQYGSFSMFDVLMTKNILIFYSIGLIPLILTKVLLSQFYSKNDFISPTIISILILIITQLMNSIFLPYLQHNSFALSSSIAAWINFILLCSILLKKKFFQFEPGWLMFLGKIFIASIVMIFILYFNLDVFSNWNSGTMLFKLYQLILICLLSGCSYLIMLFLLGFRLRHFLLIELKKINFE